MSFRLTYSTMFDPPPEFHERFEASVSKIGGRLGARHAHLIGGADVAAGPWHEIVSPIDTDRVLGSFPVATEAEVNRAVDAAAEAYPAWRATPMADRNRILRRVGTLIEERVYDIAAAVALEVGKNRMEAIGEVQETADFFYCYCDDYERQGGFDHPLPDDPLPNFASHNRSIMKPYGVWAVVSPFNFPFALAGGPTAAALVTGNTVVLKGAPETPWSVRLLADCLRDAGVPDGAFNCLADPDDSAGPRLVGHRGVAGITFTGSHETGMQILRSAAACDVPRPVIAEMGGKNAAIVTRNADLDRAALGCARSAFGLTGQKCSALSRLYVEDAVADALIDRLKQAVGNMRVGDPLQVDNYLGPINNRRAYENFRAYAADLRADADVLCGAEVLADGELGRGYYCAPTIAEAPLDHRLWHHEMFAPVLMLARVPDRESAMRLANDTPLGLTAGFYGDEAETRWFFDNIEAGVTYANRPQGATTGAWPGYQPFGGWKGSGSTGKAIASFYYLAEYLREQSQTSVD